MDFETNFEADLQSDAQTSQFENRLEPFHMRCPSCRKLYSVDASLLGIGGDDVLKFECVACRMSFLAIKPAFHGQHFIETQRLETQLTVLQESPGAAAPGLTPERSKEVARVIGSAFNAVPLRQHPTNDLELSESAELIALWATIMDKYEDVAAHETFLNRCFKEQRLAFATHKYAQILVLDPRDEIALRMRQKAIGFASFGFDATAKGLTPTNWSVPLPSFNNLMIGLGTIAVIVGMGFPNERQVSALGFAMIASALGLRYFLRRPSGS